MLLNYKEDFKNYGARCVWVCRVNQNGDQIKIREIGPKL